MGRDVTSRPARAGRCVQGGGGGGRDFSPQYTVGMLLPAYTGMDIVSVEGVVRVPHFLDC